MKNVGVVLLTLGVLVMVWWCVTLCVFDIWFDRGCGGYLKQAADSNTVETARERLGIAVKWAKENKLTDGFTSVVYRTPDEDIGFWFRNISEAEADLRQIPPNAGVLERSNALLKLRETLVDNSRNGTSVTVPFGISRYPYNTILGLLWAFGFGVFVAWLLVRLAAER